VQSDHHGKRFSKVSVSGERVFNWRYTAMNSIGQTAVAVSVETCSYSDPSLVEAHRLEREVARREGREPPRAAWCDNPHKDAPGLRAALWAGDGRPTFSFPGEIRLVESEAECDAACRYLSRFDIVGFDTENVAFLDGSGANSSKAAIGQACGDDQFCFLFLFYRWSSCYRSFASFASGATPHKVANQISHDVSALKARFPEISRRSGALELGGAVELRDEVRHLSLERHGLGFMVGALFDEYLDKSIDHRWWESPQLSGRQVKYAAADAWAHFSVCVAARQRQPEDLSPGEQEPGSDSEEDDDSEPRGPATYRHERRQLADPGLLDVIDGDTPDAGGDASADGGGEASLTPEQEDEQEECQAHAAPSDATSAAAVLLKSAVAQIDDYVRSERSTPLELSGSLSAGQRKALHVYCDRHGLHHCSVGIEGSSRRLVVCRWKALDCVTPEVGAGAVGYLVAREITTDGAPELVRGRIESFDANTFEWSLEYSDGSTELVRLDELNLRLAWRFRHDHPSGLADQACQLDSSPRPYSVSQNTSPLHYRRRGLATRVRRTLPRRWRSRAWARTPRSSTAPSSHSVYSHHAFTPSRSQHMFTAPALSYLGVPREVD